MDVQGLERDRYLINNPIWIDITGMPADTIYVRISISKLTPEGADQPGGPAGSLRFHPLNDAICFDLSEGAKSYMALPDWRQETGSGARIGTNYQRMRITLEAINQQEDILEENVLVRTFIRGGIDGMNDNLVLSQNAVLKESSLIPRWDSFPVRKFFLDDQNAIVSTFSISNEETDRKRVPGCNPLYFKFLNSVGGYSYWLFEVWDFEKSGGRENIVKDKRNYYSLGAESEHEISVEGRVEREYFKTMRALADSPEIYVLNAASKLFRDFIGSGFASRDGGWTRVFGGRNKFESTSQETLQEVKMKFELKSKRKSTVLW